MNKLAKKYIVRTGGENMYFPSYKSQVQLNQSYALTPSHNDQSTFADSEHKAHMSTSRQ